MNFENEEVISKVVEEIYQSLDLDSEKRFRCFLNYLRLVDKCYSLEKSRIESGMRGHSHHILPRSLYPQYDRPPPGSTSNWNRVLMTYKEHLVAHHLLFWMYGKSGPMANAFRRILCNKDVREVCRKIHLDDLNNWSYHHSEETRRKIGDSQKGEKNHSYGKKQPRSQVEARMKKMMESGHPMLGRSHSEESRRKISESKSGVPLSEDVRKSRLGRKNSLGVKHTEESRSNMSKAHLGKKRSEESKRSQSETLKSRSETFCPYCNRSGRSPGIETHIRACKKKSEVKELESTSSS